MESNNDTFESFFYSNQISENVEAIVQLTIGDFAWKLLLQTRLQL